MDGAVTRPPSGSGGGHRFAVQSPDTPYVLFLALALLCGLGGGNFASSMANISFFYPNRKRAMRWR